MENNDRQIAEDASDLLGEKQCYYYCTTFAFKTLKLCCLVCRTFCNNYLNKEVGVPFNHQLKIMPIKVEACTEWARNNIDCVVDSHELDQKMLEHYETEFHQKAFSWIRGQRACVDNSILNVVIPTQDVARYTVDQTPSFEGPKCWSEQQRNYYLVRYEWLNVEGNSLGCTMCAKYRVCILKDRVFGVIQFNRADQDWVNNKMTHDGGNKKQRMITLSNKLFEHEHSHFHYSAVSSTIPFPRDEKFENFQAVEPDSVETSKSENSEDDRVWPKCWTEEQKNYYRVKFQWLISKKQKIICAQCEKFWSTQRPDQPLVNWDLASQEIPDRGDESKVLNVWINKLLSHKQSTGHMMTVGWLSRRKVCHYLGKPQKLIPRANILPLASEQHLAESDRVMEGEKKVKKTVLPEVERQNEAISSKDICVKLDELFRGIGQLVKENGNDLRKSRKENAEEHKKLREELRKLRRVIGKRELSENEDEQLSTANLDHKKMKRKCEV